jgi:hypothetical protein
MAVALSPPTPISPAVVNPPRLATAGPVIALRSAGQRLVTVCTRHTPRYDRTPA